MIKPQDIVVLLKIASIGQWDLTYEALATVTGISASEAHKGLKRAAAAQLYDERRRRPMYRNLCEFVVHGVPYAFAVQAGPLGRGVPTSFAAPPLSGRFFFPEGGAPVWASATGDTRGPTVEPLYPSVPNVAPSSPDFYALLALTDAMRLGRARERQSAAEELEHRLRAER